jgi:hypothetical protein
MKNVDFAVEGLLAGEEVEEGFTRTATERETTYTLVLGGRRFIFSVRKTRNDGPHHHHADRDRP